jgi:hypothetical protein
MIEESKAELTRKRAELVEILAPSKPLTPEDRVRFQGELSILNAKIKAINTAEAAKLKAAADRRKIAGMAEAKANAARARANAGLPVEEEDDDPAQTQAIDTWIVSVLQDQGVQAASANGFSFEAPPKWAAIITALRAGLHAAARGQELPTWNGLCPAGKHGLDHEGQACDLCAAEAKGAAPKKAAKKR